MELRVPPVVIVATAALGMWLAARALPSGPPGSTGARAVVAATLAENGREYTVEAGDTLSHLARKYYGDQFKWEKIYQANKATMKNPDYIFVGQKIIIPS